MATLLNQSRRMRTLQLTHPRAKRVKVEFMQALHDRDSGIVTSKRKRFSVPSSITVPAGHKITVPDWVATLPEVQDPKSGLKVINAVKTQRLRAEIAERKAEQAAARAAAASPAKVAEASANDAADEKALTAEHQAEANALAAEAAAERAAAPRPRKRRRPRRDT